MTQHYVPTRSVVSSTRVTAPPQSMRSVRMPHTIVRSTTTTCCYGRRRAQNMVYRVCICYYIYLYNSSQVTKMYKHVDSSVPLVLQVATLHISNKNRRHPHLFCDTTDSAVFCPERDDSCTNEMHVFGSTAAAVYQIQIHFIPTWRIRTDQVCGGKVNQYHSKKSK